MRFSRGHLPADRLHALAGNSPGVALELGEQEHIARCKACEGRLTFLKRVNQTDTCVSPTGRDDVFERILETRRRGPSLAVIDLSSTPGIRRLNTAIGGRAAWAVLFSIAAVILLVAGLRIRPHRTPSDIAPAVRDVRIQGPHGETPIVRPSADPNITVIVISSEAHK